MVTIFYAFIMESLVLCDINTYIMFDKCLIPKPPGNGVQFSPSRLFMSGVQENENGNIPAHTSAKHSASLDA